MDPIAKQLHNQWLQTPETANLLKTLTERRESFIRTAIGQAVSNTDIDQIRIFLSRAHAIGEVCNDILTPPYSTEVESDGSSNES